MVKSSRTPWLVLALIAIAVVVAGAVTIGFAQTITLLAIASTFVVFYLIIQTSRA